MPRVIKFDQIKDPNGRWWGPISWRARGPKGKKITKYRFWDPLPSRVGTSLWDRWGQLCKTAQAKALICFSNSQLRLKISRKKGFENGWFRGIYLFCITQNIYRLSSPSLIFVLISERLIPFCVLLFRRLILLARMKHFGCLLGVQTILDSKLEW